MHEKQVAHSHFSDSDKAGQLQQVITLKKKSVLMFGKSDTQALEEKKKRKEEQTWKEDLSVQAKETEIY